MLGSITAMEEQSQSQQTCYGHQKLVATRCGHNIHPCSSTKTPLCPKCISSRSKANLDVAQKKLLEEGGLEPEAHMRNQHWNRARLKYHLAKQRVEDVREADQLRWEREQAWEEMHQRWDSPYRRAAAYLRGSTGCSACVSLVAPYATMMPEVQVAKSVAWWERPVAPAVPLVPKPRKSSTIPDKSRSHTAKPESTRALHQMIQKFRASRLAWHAQQQAWEIRYRTEVAFRRKHGVGGNIQFNPMFFNSPFPGLPIIRRRQHALENRRMAERRARGNVSRPNPPYSSLAYSESSDDLTIDGQWLEDFLQKEEQEELDRNTRKVAGGVGYLYFVGGNDGLREWKEDYMRSNMQLVVRRLVSKSDTSDSEDDEDDSDDTDDSDDSADSNDG